MDIAAAATADDDFDSLIDSVVKADSVCAFVKCKASVLTLGQLCLHCNRQYCLSHHIPEVHLALYFMLKRSYYEELNIPLFLSLR